jgi:hypothetical protein
MTVRCTGAEFMAFMTDQNVWKAGYYFDDASGTINGEDTEFDFDFDNDPAAIAPDAEVKLISGVFYHGETFQAENEPFTAVLKRWLKARATATLVIDIPKDQQDALRAVLKDQFPAAKVR